MDNMILIDNLSFKYDSYVFNDLSLSISKGSFTSILGNNGSGKSTLVKILLGLLKYDGDILIDGEDLKTNVKGIREIIGVVFENPESCLIYDNVFDNLSFPLENLNITRETIFSEINNLSMFLGINHLLSCNYHDLSGGEKQLVCLGCALITKPKLIILDEAFSMVDEFYKTKIFDILIKINKEYNTTILNITHDIEETIYSDKIILIDKGNIILNSNKEDVYNQDKILTKFGYRLPFMVDLSKRLSYYGLVENIVYDVDEMIDILWK